MAQRQHPETLNDLIDARGLPVGEVAELSGVSERALLALRMGVVARARVATVAGLAKALGVEPARVRAAIEATRAAAGE